MEAERDQSSERALEFETFPGRADIQVSKVMTTDAGDKIRAVVATGGTVMLTGVGKPSRDVVILEGFDPGDGGGGTVVFRDIWDVIIPIAEGLAKKIGGATGGGGGDQKCTTTVKVEQDAKTGKTTTTFSTTCGPA